jgi:hypothetical protein
MHHFASLRAIPGDTAHRFATGAEGAGISTICRIFSTVKLRREVHLDLTDFVIGN